MEAAQGINVPQLIKLKSEIVDLLRLDEKMWQQRIKEHWMVLRDRNPKYFHTRASQRFCRNRIVELRNTDGALVSGDANVLVMVLAYYKNLFSSSRQNEIDEVVQSIKFVITEDMNRSLASAFSWVEIETALNQMAPLKAPRPDRMPPIFFQNFWSDIGDDVVQAILSCLNSSNIISGLNHTFISIIPKVKNPKYATEFCCIALCNILYKLVSKVLANRLKKVLPHII